MTTAAAANRKGSTLIEDAAAGAGAGAEGIGEGVAEGIAVDVGRGVGAELVCTGEGITIEGGTEGMAGESDCPKPVDVWVFVGEAIMDGVGKGVPVG